MESSNKPSEVFNVRLPLGLIAKIKQIAVTQRRTASQVVRIALEDMVAAEYRPSVSGKRK